MRNITYVSVKFLTKLFTKDELEILIYKMEIGGTVFYRAPMDIGSATKAQKIFETSNGEYWEVIMEVQLGQSVFVNNLGIPNL